MVRVAARAGGAEHDMLDPAVDPVKGEVEPPRARPFPRQAKDQIEREPLGGAGQIGGIGDRLGKAQPHPADRRFAQWRQRLRADRPAPGRGAAPPLRRTGGPAPRAASHKDRRSASSPTRRNPWAVAGSRRSASTGNRARPARVSPAGRMTARSPSRRKAGQCPGGADRVGDGDPAGDAPTAEPGHEIGGERGLAAPQMGRAGDLDLDPVGAVGGGPRAVAAAPFGQPPQRRRHPRRARPRRWRGRAETRRRRPAASPGRDRRPPPPG